jgi:hypothetical protein
VSAPGAAPALALLPPQRPSLPPPAREPSPAGRRRQVVARRFAAAGCVAGALLPVAFVAAGPYLGEAAYVGLVVPWALLLPGCGLALLLAAALGRTRDDLRALVLAALSLAAGVALIGPAGRLGAEAFVSSHAVELDGVAAELVAAHSSAVARNGSVRTDYTFDGATAPARALARLGLGVPRLTRGGLRFDSSAPFAPDLLYAHASLDGFPADCPNERVRPVGGRWFLYECRARRAESED